MTRDSTRAMRTLCAVLLLCGCLERSTADGGQLPDPTDSGADAGQFDAGQRDAGSDAGVSNDGGYTSWTDCGFIDAGCTCKGVKQCSAITGGVFTGLGSHRVRVCARDGLDCVFTVFDETEGGGIARRCRVPVEALTCSQGQAAWSDGGCTDLFSCNQLMGNCPAELTPCP